MMGISLNKKCCRRELGDLLLLLVLGLNPMTTWGSRLLHHIEKPDSSSIVDSSLNFFDVLSQGAVGDGQTDDSKVFEKTWKLACENEDGVMLIPPGKAFLISAMEFKGSCKGKITFQLEGAILAPQSRHDYPSDMKWITFEDLENLHLQGSGQFNGRGQEFWTCRKDDKCDRAPTAVIVSRCASCILSNINFVDSQQVHLKLTECTNGIVDSVTITAPADSPNTDGIHITASTGMIVQNSHITTGDDCVSISKACHGIKINNVYCGPGCHGISVGSLGRNGAHEEVSDVEVTGCTFEGTTNGVRIKTWQGGKGIVSNFAFSDIQMKDVSNPIIIDQKYCPKSEGKCSGSPDGLQVQNISYTNIRGTSATSTAVKFDCSENQPCSGISMSGIDLKSTSGEDAESECTNAHGSASGDVKPPACFN